MSENILKCNTIFSAGFDGCLVLQDKDYCFSIAAGMVFETDDGFSKAPGMQCLISEKYGSFLIVPGRQFLISVFTPDT